jgi:hypothetical protein
MRETAPVGRADSVHVMGQVAACRRTVGVALVPRPALVELRGDPDQLGAIALRLTGGRCRTGQAVRVGFGWWQTVTPRRALLLADASGRAAFDRLIAELSEWTPDVALEDLCAGYACVILAGPLAGRLAATPAARLAQPVMSACDGDDYRVLVLRSARAADTHHVLLAMAGGDGAVSVAAAAVELHRAARRIATAQRAASNCSLTNAPTTGVLSS